MTMTPELRNALNYALLAAGAFAFGCISALLPQLMDPTMPVINFRIVLGTGLSALVAAYGGSFLPRQGSTGLAKQVNDLRAQGVPRDEMLVIDPLTLPDVTAMTPDQRRRLAEALKAEMMAQP